MTSLNFDGVDPIRGPDHFRSDNFFVLRDDNGVSFVEDLYDVGWKLEVHPDVTPDSSMYGHVRAALITSLSHPGCTMKTP